MTALASALISYMLGEVTLSAAISSITVSTWVEIALSLVTALPEEKAWFQKLSPVFDKLIADIEAGVPAERAGFNAHSWIAANADAAIRVQNQFGPEA